MLAASLSLHPKIPEDSRVSFHLLLVYRVSVGLISSFS